MDRVKSLDRGGGEGEDGGSGDVINPLDLAHNNSGYGLDEPEDCHQRYRCDEVPREDEADHDYGAQDKAGVLDELLRIEGKSNINWKTHHQDLFNLFQHSANGTVEEISKELTKIRRRAVP